MSAIWPARQPVCTVLGYHEIAPLAKGMRRSLVVSPATFAGHLFYLRAIGARCIRLEDLALALAGTVALPCRAFAITFDDGYVGVYRHALPLLKRFGYTATVFVPSALVGQKESRSDVAPVAKMDVSQLRQLANAGISIGAHTRTHPHLPEITESEQQQEIRLCRKELEGMLDRPITTFAYPFGALDGSTIEIVKNAGYAIGCTTRYAKVHTTDSPYAVPRILIGDNTALPRFAYRLLRARAVRQ